MILTLPLPPSLNNMFLNVRGRGRVKSPEYRAWREHAGQTLRLAARGSIERPYSVTIAVNINRRSDLDNRTKPILDALVDAGLICGDNWVDRILVRRDPSVDASECKVVVSSMQDALA